MDDTVSIACLEARHLPRVVRQWLADEPSTRCRRIPGSLVFADVSGFTALTERLADRGKVGAEDLTDILGAVMGELLTLADDRGGDLLKYGGDALLLLFTGEDHAARALTATAAMQDRISIRRRSRAGNVTLGMSIGVASGDIDLLLLGGRHRELVVAGPVAERVVALEHDAVAGQIRIDDATRAAVPHATTSADGDGWLLEDPGPDRARSDPPVADVVTLDASTARIGISEQLRAVVTERPGAEHRNVCVGFVQVRDLPPIEPDEDSAGVALLDELFRVAQDACATAGVTFLSSDVDQGAAKIILTAGAPAASDVDVDRMITATRAIVESGLPLTLRAGVNSGRVFAVELGTADRRFYTVLGDAVNLAARVMAHAPDGTVVATDHTLVDAREDLAVQELEPFSVKGKRDPVEAAVVGAATNGPVNGSARGDDGADAEPQVLLGRDDEVDAVGRALRTVDDPHPTTVTVVGAAGMGKSAIVEAALGGVENLFVLRIDGGVVASGTPYYAMRAVLRLALGLGSGASDDDVISAIVSHGTTDIADWLPLVTPPFGVTLPDTDATARVPAQFRRARTRALITDLLRPLIDIRATLVVENAQWLDDASRDLLQHILGAFADLPWVVVVTARGADSVLDLHRPGRQVHLELGPLDDGDAATLVAGSGDDRLPPDAVRSIVERAEGNPLFLRELAAAVRRGMDPDNLPDRVERLYTARVDALGAADRELLRSAAVLGGRVHHDVLVEIARQGPLTRAEVRHRLHGFIVADGDNHRFIHTMARESAYEGLSFRRRRQLHGQVAEHLSTRFADNPDPVIELLARHNYLAERWEETWRWASAAGERAAASDAPVEAARFFGWAITAARHVAPAPDVQRRVLRRLALSCELSGRLGDADKALQRACRITEDPVELAELYALRGRVRSMESRYDASRRWHRRGLELVGATGSAGADRRAGRPRMENRLGHAHALMRQRKLLRCLDDYQAVIDDRAASDNADLVARALSELGGAKRDLGLPGVSDAQDEAEEIFTRLGDLQGMARGIGNRAVTAYYEGDWASAIHDFHRAAEFAEQAGDLHNLVVLQANVAEVICDSGRADEARDILLDALASARAARYNPGMALSHSYLGRALVRLGDLDEASRHLTTAHELWRTVGDAAFALEARLREAELHLVAGHHDRAGTVLAAVAAEQAMIDSQAWLRPMVPRITAVVEARSGRLEHALELLDDARCHAEGHSRFEEVQALDCTARVLRLLGRAADAEEVADRAAALADALGIIELPHVPLEVAPVGQQALRGA